MSELSPDEESSQREARYSHMPIAERRQAFEDIFVPHPRITQPFREIRRRIDRVIQTGVSETFVVSAPTGSGKTTLINLLLQAQPYFLERQATGICFSPPGKPTEKAMTMKLLQALDDPLRARRKNAEDAFQAGVDFCFEKNVRLICIDNFHDIVERRSTRGAREITNWVRNLHDKVSSVIVLLGAEAVEETTRANKQVLRRASSAARMDYFDIASAMDLRAWATFIHAYLEKLPLENQIELRSAEFLMRMHAATAGIPGMVKALLKEALDIALAEKKESIDQQILQAAYSAMFVDRAGKTNPFDPAVSVSSLDQVEAFDAWCDLVPPKK